MMLSNCVNQAREGQIFANYCYFLFNELIICNTNGMNGFGSGRFDRKHISIQSTFTKKGV